MQRIGVFVCWCGSNIAATVDVKAVAEAAKSEAFTQGAEKIYLEVRSGNQRARAFYLKNGFTELGIRKNYYKNPTEDAILMSLDLN